MTARKKLADSITFQYEPRDAFIPLHQRHQRWACMVVHRRGGKTVACIHELVLRALYCKKKNGRYAYIAPYARQARDVAWQYLKDAVEGIAVKVRESSLRVELPNGAWITLYGSDNPNMLRGLYLDGCILDEFGDCRPSLWSTVVLPCLVDRKGWAIFIGTPKGKNHFYKIHQRSIEEDGWYSLTLKASESGIIPNTELLEMKAQMEENEYAQEMECSFTAAVQGTFYAATIEKMELQGFIKPKLVQYDSTLPVQCAADVGRSDSTAFWFWQQTPTAIHIIDYYEHSGEGPDHYIQMLRDRKYNYETVWLPHDAKAKTMATKRSTVEQFLLAGLPCRVVPKLDVQHGIDAVRKVLPKCLFDGEKCFHGIEALRAYRRTYNELDKCFSNEPKHDWSSDGADAFRYLALVCKDSLQPLPPTPPMVADDALTYNFNLNDLYEERAERNRSVNLRI